MNAAEAERGCEKRIRSVSRGNFRPGEETSGSTVGGEALEARSRRTQVWQRKGVRRADGNQAVQRSALATIGHITGVWWCPAVRKWGEGNFMP